MYLPLIRANCYIFHGNRLPLSVLDRYQLIKYLSFSVTFHLYVNDQSSKRAVGALWGEHVHTTNYGKILHTMVFGLSQTNTNSLTKSKSWFYHPFPSVHSWTIAQSKQSWHLPEVLASLFTSTFMSNTTTKQSLYSPGWRKYRYSWLGQTVTFLVTFDWLKWIPINELTTFSIPFHLYIIPQRRQSVHSPGWQNVHILN